MVLLAHPGERDGSRYRFAVRRRVTFSGADAELLLKTLYFVSRSGDLFMTLRLLLLLLGLLFTAGPASSLATPRPTAATVPPKKAPTKPKVTRHDRVQKVKALLAQALKTTKLPEVKKGLPPILALIDKKQFQQAFEKTGDLKRTSAFALDNRAAVLALSDAEKALEEIAERVRKR